MVENTYSNFNISRPQRSTAPESKPRPSTLGARPTGILHRETKRSQFPRGPPCTLRPTYLQSTHLQQSTHHSAPQHSVCNTSPPLHSAARVLPAVVVAAGTRRSRVLGISAVSETVAQLALRQELATCPCHVACCLCRRRQSSSTRAFLANTPGAFVPKIASRPLRASCASPTPTLARVPTTPTIFPNGSLPAEHAIAGVDVVWLQLHPRHQTEHNELSGWFALDARVEALFRHCIVPVDECQSEGS